MRTFDLSTIFCSTAVVNESCTAPVQLHSSTNYNQKAVQYITVQLDSSTNQNLPALVQLISEHKAKIRSS